MKVKNGIGDMTPPYNDIIIVGDKSSLDPDLSCRGFYDRIKNELKIIYYTREILSPYQLSNVYVEKVFTGKKI